MRRLQVRPSKPAALENTAGIKEAKMKVPRAGQGVTHERKIECEMRLLVYAC